LAGGTTLLQGDATSADPDGCVWDASDPFEPHVVMPSGPFRGRCIFPGVARSLVALDEERAAPYDPQPGERLIANFRHDGRFWIARIPPYDVALEEVVFLVEKFIEKGGHMMLRYVMREGFAIELIPQVPPDELPRHPERRYVRDVVYTPEAVGVEGDGYSIAKALAHHFFNAYRFLSTEEKLEETPNRVEQLPLRLTNEDKLEVAEAGVRRSMEMGLTNPYRITHANCSTEVFRVLDAALDYREYGGAAEGNTADVRKIEDLLGVRGILDADRELPDLTAAELVR
jgi:hypothetical protein